MEVSLQKNKVLIIEDEEGIREGLVEILSGSFDVITAENGIEGLKKAFKEAPQLILLDLKMPEMDGFQVCKAIRSDKEFDSTPIIVVTAFNNVTDRTRLFEMGVDDYITKPFDGKELIARIQRALLRVSNEKELIQHAPSNTVVKCDELVLDGHTQKVFYRKIPIHLSAIEFKILYILALNYNQIVRRDKILDYAWEKQPVSPRLIDPHILAIREKLKDHKFSIHAIYGKGYILKNL